MKLQLDAFASWREKKAMRELCNPSRLRCKKMSLVIAAFCLFAAAVSLIGTMTSDAQSQTEPKTKIWNLEQALDAYQTLSSKTVLRPSQLPALTLTMASDSSSNGPAAVAHLEDEFNRSGLQVLQDGPHFVWIVPWNVTEVLTNLPFRGAELALSAKKLPAIETTFALNGFVLISVGDNSIRLGNNK